MAKPKVRKRKSSFSGFLLKLICVLAIMAAVLYFLFGRIFALNVVYEDSMYPGICASDTTISFRHSYVRHDPCRGDVVIYPANGIFVIKRIIGIEGDKIQVKGGRVFLNGELLEEPYLDNVLTDGDQEYVVPDGMLFCMGDNRDASYDSRHYANPYVDRESVKGRVFCVIHDFYHVKWLPRYLTQTGNAGEQVQYDSAAEILPADRETVASDGTEQVMADSLSAVGDNVDTVPADSASAAEAGGAVNG